ncbi:MAG: 50S ribosomal protein L18 [Bacteriovoracaceae bacterium]|jgi:large subunit ribosomal protein L18|nr:50S ribosomal protein L18 [Bacteriovoracaceae bacterium]
MRKQYKKIKSDTERTRYRRKLTIRKKISGTAERPRLCVQKSNKHFRVQVVDDELGKTLFSVQTFGKNSVEGTANKAGAKAVGIKVAEELKGKGLTTAVFDRGGNMYAGSLSTLADTIREAGIKI